MRSYDAHSKYDPEEAERLRAEPWMLTLLKMNPSYPHWGPHEDYMWKKGDGWDSPQFFPTWKDFGPWGLDDMNEIVHFYFSIQRDNIECKECNGTGYHPDALWISESFYNHSTPFVRHDKDSFFYDKNYSAEFPDEEILAKYGDQFLKFCEEMRDGDGHWDDKITQDEVEALVNDGRLWDFTRVPLNDEQAEEVKQKVEAGGNNWLPHNNGRIPTAEEVNNKQHERGFGSHDGINRGILISRRCERLGVPTTCPTCEGHGYVYTAPDAHVRLTLWVLHPRKGCSRGVEIETIQQNELPEVYKLLKEASTRNRKRFAKAVRACNKALKEVA
jgi:hypothetical protein